VRVRAVGARLEVEPAVEPERADLHGRVRLEVAGEERVDDPVGLVERPQGLRHAGIHVPLGRERVLPGGHLDDELLQYGG
jgi:hypothetical protein